MMKQRALLKTETAVLRSIYIGTGEIGRQQVGSELDALEITLDTAG